MLIVSIIIISEHSGRSLIWAICVRGKIVTISEVSWFLRSSIAHIHMEFGAAKSVLFIELQGVLIRRVPERCLAMDHLHTVLHGFRATDVFSCTL